MHRFFSRFGWGGQDATRKYGDDKGRDKKVTLKEAANDGER